MLENIITALKIMGQGMLGIFAAILVIMAVMMIIQKVSSPKKKDSTQTVQNQ